MSVFSAKGIAAGVFAFIGWVSVAFFATNSSGVELGVPIVFILWAFTWIAPGYAAARYSSSDHLLNSAAAGALVGIAAGTALLTNFELPTNMPVTEPMLFAGCVAGAVVSFGLGGLLCSMFAGRRAA